VDSWPKYRSSVYEKWLGSGDLDHANRLGLAVALAFEGADLPKAEAAIGEAIAALERDGSLEPDTFGGIDWELGFAVYELFWRYADQDAASVWSAFPPTSTWSAVLAKAVNLYQEYCPEDSERISTLLSGYEASYESRKREALQARLLEEYRALVLTDIEACRARGDMGAAEHLGAVLSDLDNPGAR
jgi:hypothetical protein